MKAHVCPDFITSLSLKWSYGGCASGQDPTALSLNLLVAKCEGGAFLSLLADASTLIPVVGGGVAGKYGDVAPRDKRGSGFPWEAGGIMSPIFETLNIAYRSLEIGVVAADQAIVDHHVTIFNEEKFYDYSGTWAIITSWAGTFNSFVTNPESYCGQELSNLKLIDEAIKARVTKK